MKEKFTKIMREDLNQKELPKGFDQRFFNKLEQQKAKELSSKAPLSEALPNAWQRILSYFAPMGFATALGLFVILWTTTNQTSIDQEERTEILSNLQTQEVAELSTLSDKQWDQLLSAAQ